MRERRYGRDVDIIVDFRTVCKCKINLTDYKERLLIPSVHNGSYTVIMMEKPEDETASRLRRKGMNVIEHDRFNIEARYEIISSEIDSLSGENTVLLLFPGLRAAPAIEKLIDRNPDCKVIVLAANNEEQWRELGALVIKAKELPKRRIYRPNLANF